MTLPYNITNGTLPDATEVMDNLEEAYKLFSSHTPLFGGDGSDGALSTSGNVDLNRGQEYNYTDLTINSGHVLSVTGGNSNDEPVWIKVSGDCTITGTIDVSGKGLQGGAGSTSSSSGSGSDGTGNTYFVLPGIGGTYTGGGLGTGEKGGGGGAGSRGHGKPGPTGGGAGGTIGPGGINFYSVLAGAGGGGGGGGVIATSGSGGAGGGAVYLEVKGDLTITGTVDVSGEDGGDSVSSGGGGGGGGSFVAHCLGAINISSGTFSADGGVGGTSTSSLNGGDGGPGKIIIINKGE